MSVTENTHLQNFVNQYRYFVYNTTTINNSLFDSITYILYNEASPLIQLAKLTQNYDRLAQPDNHPFIFSEF
ncbi:MAG: hypothetical protein GX921_07165 [Bacteroidales bacterium]|nr:hypothetical protein [Bacteroidales bacterium]